MDEIQPPDLTEAEQQLNIVQELMSEQGVEPFVDAAYVKKMNEVLVNKLNEVIREMNRIKGQSDSNNLESR